MFELEKKIEEHWKAMLEMLAMGRHGRPLLNSVFENLFFKASYFTTLSRKI